MRTLHHRCIASKLCKLGFDVLISLIKDWINSGLFEEKKPEQYQLTKLGYERIWAI